MQIPIPTVEELQQRWAESLRVSQKAIYRNHSAYCELRRMVHRINTEALDVSEYYLTAVRLGAILRELSADYGNSLFRYFAEHIDPRRQGDVRCFRMECRQLSEQLAELDRRRTTGQGLRIVQRVH